MIAETIVRRSSTKNATHIFKSTLTRLANRVCLSVAARWRFRFEVYWNEEYTRITRWWVTKDDSKATSLSPLALVFFVQPGAENRSEAGVVWLEESS